MPADSGFKDHFSGHAAAYAGARPTYPRELFEWLAAQAPGKEFAWDCATGNGQAAGVLAEFFDAVVASDASARQIESADAVPGVEYRVVPAEASGLESDSVDLVTVAQALHWFDVDAFFAEVLRVLRPRGLLAYWCYGLCHVDAAIDEIVRAVYAHVDDWWPPERTLVERRYRDIDPPFSRLPTPSFEMSMRWSEAQMLAYLATWSAYQRFAKESGTDPLQPFAGPLHEAWGPGEKTVRWPLHLTVCRRPAAGA